jgi:hypothetical protein
MAHPRVPPTCNAANAPGKLKDRSPQDSLHDRMEKVCTVGVWLNVQGRLEILAEIALDAHGLRQAERRWDGVVRTERRKRMRPRDGLPGPHP